MGLGVTITVNGAPDPELSDAGDVEVRERAGEPTTYRIRYPVEAAGGTLTLLNDGRLSPGSELAVLVPVAGVPECLVRGPVRGQRIRLEHGGAGSQLDVEGSDGSIAMDREARSVVWANVTDSDAVTTIVANYGFAPDVQVTEGRHLETGHTLVQRETDFQFVRRLARRNGFLFWVTSNVLGLSAAHFRRPTLDGRAETKLVINLDRHTIDRLDLSWDVERPSRVEARQLEIKGKRKLDADVSGTPERLLGAKGLEDVAGGPRTVFLSAPADDAGDLQARAEGTVIEASWFVRATCETTLEAMGRLVRGGSLAELFGAGYPHSGTYFVTGVTHRIDASAHRMEIELVRNALGANGGGLGEPGALGAPAGLGLPEGVPALGLGG